MRAPVRVALAAWIILASLPLLGQAQTPQATHDELHGRLDKYGTCATTVLAPSGVAFIIDSRVTEIRNDQIVSQHPGCKVLLARPTILLAGVGLEDTTGRADHWNSLDEAAAALKRLPENPTEDQLNRWSMEWGQTLVDHYRRWGETLPPASGLPLSEVLLITRIGNEFYLKRTGVVFNDGRFTRLLEGQLLDKTHPQVEYAGACRQFAVHSDYLGHNGLPPMFPRSRVEEGRLAYWGNRKMNAKTVDDLAAAAYGFESIWTAMDERLEGEHAVIAPPYASAELGEDDKEWHTMFNAECESANMVK
jgi:hypothetical protein